MPVKSKGIKVTDLERSILKIFNKDTFLGVREVHDTLMKDHHFLDTMRAIHKLVDKGLLLQIKSDRGSLYGIRRNLISLKKYL